MFGQTSYMTCHRFSFTENELQNKIILSDVQLLTTNTLSSKVPTLNCDSIRAFALNGLDLLNEVKIIESINQILY